MTTKLKYTGLSQVRTFAKADFSRNGMEGGSALKFDSSNNWIAEVEDDEVAQWLIENDPELREATDDDETKSDRTRVGPPGVVRVRSASDESTGSAAESDGTTEGASSRAGRGSTARSRS